MTAELDRIRSLHAGITPGPWEVDGMDAGHSQYGMNIWVATKDGDVICDMDGLARSRNDKAAKDDGHADAAFIAAAPSTVTHLLAIIDAALNACEVIIDNADGHKPPGPPHPSREQIAALRIQRAIRAAITGEGA